MMFRIEFIYMLLCDLEMGLAAIPKGKADNIPISNPRVATSEKVGKKIP